MDPAHSRPQRSESSDASPRRWRLFALGLLLVALLAAGKLSGWTDSMDVEKVRNSVDSAGPLGFLLYAALFAGGEFIHIPGLVFVASGILIYGKAVGYVAALFAGLGAACFSFLVARKVGGKVLAGIERPYIKKMLGRLNARPILTVFLLRSVLVLLPALNYTLALTELRFRHYLIGSFLGLVVPLGLATLLFDQLIAWLAG